MQGVTTGIIASGDTISATVDVSRGRVFAISCPTITSADLLVRASFDTTSASFVRLQNTLPNTGDMRFASAVGSNMMLWPANQPSPPYLRFETSVAQPAPRTFSVLFR